jgi:hypothetical protein
MAGGPQPFSTAVDQFKYVVYKDPNWDWHNFDIERGVVLADKADNDTINVPSDLKGFNHRGGKLLMYHAGAIPMSRPARASISTPLPSTNSAIHRRTRTGFACSWNPAWGNAGLEKARIHSTP